MTEKDPHKVHESIPPGSVNPKLTTAPKSVKALEYYTDGLKKGNRYILGESITLVESKHPDKRKRGLEILEYFYKSSSNNTTRIGITGSPGVGKSTFIETLGKHIITSGKKVAVLSIDPSSTLSQGSILGDKTRMHQLSTDPNAFIRPSASGNTLGGVARNTKESMLLCEAAGFDVVIVETVGVGQSETFVSSIVDIFLLLLLPGAGDEIQGIKRGIVELADLIIINKADEDRENLALMSRKAYANALKLLQPKFEDWSVPVTTASALYEKGIDKTWENINTYMNMVRRSGFYTKNRTDQDVNWFKTEVDHLIKTTILNHDEIKSAYLSLSNDVDNSNMSPFKASHLMGELIEKKLKM